MADYINLTDFVPTMKTLDGVNKKNDVSHKAVQAVANDVNTEPEKIDFSKVEIEPLFKDFVDFETSLNRISES